jgi:hypothetical protein
VFQGPVGKVFTAVVVDQNHEGDRQPSNDVKKNKALLRFHHCLLGSAFSHLEQHSSVDCS